MDQTVWDFKFELSPLYRGHRQNPFTDWSSQGANFLLRNRKLAPCEDQSVKGFCRCPLYKGESSNLKSHTV